MARRRIVVAMMMHETNTFSPVPTPLASFRPLSGGAAIEEFRDTNTQLGGFLDAANAAGAEVNVPLAGFEPIARHIVMCDGDGCTSSDLRLFTFRNRRRPLYPFEAS